MWLRRGFAYVLIFIMALASAYIFADLYDDKAVAKLNESAVPWLQCLDRQETILRESGDLSRMDEIDVRQAIEAPCLQSGVFDQRQAAELELFFWIRVKAAIAWMILINIVAFIALLSWNFSALLRKGKSGAKGKSGSGL